KTARA
ncbi:D-methionine-binding lipoprotein metQ, partial [Vibrio parahaemolyticus V-223/04]